MQARLLPRRAYSTVVPLAGAVAAAGFVRWWQPFEPRALGCPFHLTTGLWCPGCGSTRAIYALTNGDLSLAMRCNVLVIPMLLLLTYLWVSPLLPARFKRFGRNPTALPTWFVTGLAVLFLAFGVARNLPAFDVLAPVASR